MMSDETQNRLGNLVDVLNKVWPQFATLVMAYQWYRPEPLAGFDDQTEMQLVQASKAHQVVKYIEAVGAKFFNEQCEPSALGSLSCLLWPFMEADVLRS